MTAPHILIAGAGVGGLTVALALAQRGRSVEVFERRQHNGTLGAGLVLWPNATRVLDELGLLERMRAVGGTLRSMKHLDPTGDVLCDLDLHLLQHHMGGPAVPITRADLQQVLLDAVRALDVPVHFGRRVESVRSDEHVVCVLIEGGAGVEGDLLIGADGRMASTCRTFVHGANKPVYQRYVNWVGLVESADLALDIGHVLDFRGTGVRFGLVPLSEHRAYWAGCRALPEHSAAPTHGDKVELQQIFAGWAHPIADVIAHTPDAAIRRIPVYDHNPIHTWHRGRVVLLGDAAHAALPTSGQGACQAIEDAWHLANALDEHPGEHRAAFAAYTDRRRAKTTGIVHQGRGLARALFNTDPERSAARDAASRATDPVAAVHGIARFWGM